jgi:AraC-like DNA-binding protein
MPAMPLPFVVALLLVILLVRLVRRDQDRPTDLASMIFIGACIVMVIVVGLRWSFDLKAIRSVQPIVAATLPPIAWICFAGLAGPDTRMPSRLWLHAIPVGLITILSAVGQPWRPPIDLILAVQFFGYGQALLRFGWAGPDALEGARLADAAKASKAVIVAGLILIGSGLIDLSVAIDFDFYRGAHAASIVAIANLVTLSLIAYAVAIAGRSLPGVDAHPSTPDAGAQTPTIEPPPQPESPGPGDVRILEIFDRLMREKQLFRDPDLTLNRLARRALIPSRQISAAINRVHGQSVSRAVNEYRIAEAGRLLVETELPITTIMFECGFQTKSNFNREFLRVTGMSPSDYRRSTPSERIGSAVPIAAEAPPPGTR